MVNPGSLNQRMKIALAIDLRRRTVVPTYIVSPAVSASSREGPPSGPALTLVGDG